MAVLRISFSVVVVCSIYLKGSNGGSVADCPPYFDDYFDGSCFFYSHDYETWTGAMISCSILGGHLVEIENADEFRHIQDATKQHAQCDMALDHTRCETRWLGLSDKRESGRWEWATSHTVYTNTTFSMWAPGEPDKRKGQSDESCVVIDYFPNLGHYYTLADVDCVDPRHRYICEYTPSTLPLVNGFGK